MSRRKIVGREASVAGLPAMRAYAILFAEAAMMEIPTEGGERRRASESSLKCVEVWSVAVDRKPEVVIDLQSSKQIADPL